MATTLNVPSASVNASGDITSVLFSGSFDSCSDLRIDVFDDSGELLLTGPVVRSGTAWSKSISAPNDFAVGDFVCGGKVHVELKCRDTDPPTVVLPLQPVTIDCGDCVITIDSADGIPAASGQGLERLTIHGTANCASVIVEIFTESSPPLTAPVSGGQWEASFTQDADTRLKAVHCQTEIPVKVTCEEDKDCHRSKPVEISCAEPPCPNTADVRLTGPNVDIKNPTDAELECETPGDYTIKCTTLAPSYVWRSNDEVVAGADSALHVVSVKEPLQKSAAVTVV